jgi:hypothetical protein
MLLNVFANTQVKQHLQTLAYLYCVALGIYLYLSVRVFSFGYGIVLPSLMYGF